MYAEYLRGHRFRVVELDNTAEALAAAPMADVVVTDIRVPGPFDGVELVRRLRADDHAKHTPVIVLTACVFEPDRQRAHAAGCDLFLPKPCLPDALAIEIRRLLAARSPRPRPARATLRQRGRGVA